MAATHVDPAPEGVDLHQRPWPAASKVCRVGVGVEREGGRGCDVGAGSRR